MLGLPSPLRRHGRTYTTNGDLLSIPGHIASIEYGADGQTKRSDYANGVYTTFTYSPTRR
ncbi:MAG: hypothetical protein KF694_01770 [Mesorhizobium sp.]|nr:hypothetical protein [Mesorhizobium sp.]